LRKVFLLSGEFVMTEDSAGGSFAPAPHGRPIGEILNEFETAWNSEQRRSIEDYLEGTPVSDQTQLLQELLHSEMILRRQEKNSLAVEEYLNRFPQHEQIINRVHSAIFTETVHGSAISPIDQETVMGPSIPRPSAEDKTLMHPGQGKPVPSKSQSSETEVMKKFGEYDLLEELGRGGMGIVYRARNRTTKRIVALKLILPDRLQDQMTTRQQDVIERFQNEARAASQLDHDHLVTIYVVGIIDGQHFFSMKYVDGKSLSELLHEGPLDGKQAAAYLEPVARALQEAHSHGVLHRDLKPQNILIEKKSQRALVMDFGLAKLMNEETNLTQTGEIMGTPQYMSPEQVRDSGNVTHLTDVYALGATLYHIITGHPPFQAATVMEVLRMVLDREPVSPQLLNPTIDQDLQTICLKCLEKDPEKRYASAGELAEELERFLEGRPILARPIGVWGRTWRWAKRNKSVAGLLTSTTTFLLIAFVAVLVGYIQTSKANRIAVKSLAEKGVALQAKEVALEKAEESSRETRRAINDYFTTISEETLLNQRGARPLRKKLLTKAVEFYKRFLEERKDDPSIRDEVGEAFFRVGRITKTIAAPSESLKWLEQARHIQEQLVKEQPDDVHALFDLGNTLNLEGEVFIRMKRYDAALDILGRALKLRLRLTKLVPDRLEYQRKLANTHMNIGLLKRQNYREKETLQALEKETLQALEEARGQMNKAQSIRVDLIARDANNLKVLRDYSIGAYNLANLIKKKFPSDAKGHLIDAVASCRKILLKDEADFEKRFLLATCYRLLGDLMYSKSYDESEKKNIEQALHYSQQAYDWYRQARKDLESLSSNNPNVDVYKSPLAQLYNNLSNFETEIKQLGSALELSKKAEKMFLELIQKNPNVKSYEEDLEISQDQILKIKKMMRNRSHPGNAAIIVI
jgi:serine/threonine protein kinase